MGKRSKQQSLWPATAGCALAAAAIVVTLLVPLDPAPRSWIVRGLLVALALVVCAWVVLRGRVEPTRINRPERIAFQTMFFWGFFTGLTYAVPAFGRLDPGRAVIGGAIAGVLFGAGLSVLDPWVVQRSAARSSAHPSPADGQEGSDGRRAGEPDDRIARGSGPGS